LWADTIYYYADVSDIIVDGSDNVIIIGNYKDSVLIVSTKLIQTGISNFGGFIVKYTFSGNLLWVKDGIQISPDIIQLASFEIDSADNIWLPFSDFTYNILLVKLDPSGNVLSTIEQPGVLTISDINLDNSGNL